MTTIKTTLFDCHAGCEVPASIHFGLDADEVLAVEAEWGPVRKAAVERLAIGGIRQEQSAEHGHWDWSRKIPKFQSPSFEVVGVEVAGQWQGLMLLGVLGFESRALAQQGCPLVYVDYLEVAPWNYEPFVQSPRFSQVGKRLMSAAVFKSDQAGFDGLVGLHSLAQAKGFYERKCKMVRFGPDPDYQGLEYYEMTAERAEEILTRGGL